jgi:sec-independent protein translocase protein TatA
MYSINLLNIGAVQYAGWFGGYEVILIVVVVLLLFGGRKIPELMRGIGKGIKEFKSGISEDNNDGTGKASAADTNGADKK